jgi:hypothetical protein
MNAKDLLKDLRDAVKGASVANQNAIQIDALLRYLDNWETSASGLEQETTAQHARKLEEWKAQLSVSSASSMEMFKAVIEAGQTALKSSIVINGGAAAALLAVLAEALKAEQPNALGALLSPLGWAWLSFMSGLGLAGFCTAIRYLSQASYAEAMRLGQGPDDGNKYRAGTIFKNIAVGLCILSYVLFLSGVAIVFCVVK